MAMNAVQFQPRLSMMASMERYGSDDKCEAALIESRWPNGFVCPARRSAQSNSFRRGGRLYHQCSGCRHLCSVTIGTISEATKLPLTRWFLAMHLLTQSKNNVAALELMRHLGVCYKTAWLIKQKLTEVVRVREEQRRQLDGRMATTGAGKARAELQQFRTIKYGLGNLKTALSGTYHAFDFAKYAHRYVAEAQY